MRRYIVTMFIIAFLVGTLFKAADQTGIRLMKMFGTIGIFLFGVVGSLAVSRWQSRTGLKEIEAALKSLEPEFLITDWAYRGGGRPDYVLVGSGALVAVCLEEVAQTSRAKSAEGKIAKSRLKVQDAVRWLRDRIRIAAPDLKAPLGNLLQEMPVAAVVILARRKALPEYTADGVAVLNADQLAAHLRALNERAFLGESERIKVTRLLREQV